ncbi:aminoglycoside phosphotransferase family protein [Macrococcus capreoli]|uniref:aminoglycoside phosphotransferase family protein n=1 Tax=Macrococcus capreoli TaxID=2982690 RepID=UPI003EE7940B
MNINDLNKTILNLEFVSIQPFHKGWSEDQKFIVKDIDNKHYLLRISPLEKLEEIQLQIKLVEACMAKGLSVQKLVNHGKLNDTYYLLYEWIDGAEAKDLLPQLPEDKQYQLGLEAGRVLKSIHNIPCNDEWRWRNFFLDKIERKMQLYADCPEKYDNDECLFKVFERYNHRLIDQPLVYHHGDYHVGNMVIDDKLKLWIIDFDRCSIGAPFEEFNRISWCVNTSEAFSRGRVDGYFDGEVPIEFWEVLTIYLSSNILSSLPWAVPFGKDQVQVMKDEYAVQYQQYDGFTKVIPNWYSNL